MNERTADFSLYKKVNVLEDERRIFHIDKITVENKLFYSITLGGCACNFFNNKHKKKLLLREAVEQFVLKRMEIPCVEPYITVKWMDDNETIKIPDKIKNVYQKDISSIFENGKEGNYRIMGNLELEKIGLSPAADVLMEKIRSQYNNEGIIISKYKVTNEPFREGMLGFPFFVEKVYHNQIMLADRAYLNIPAGELPKVKVNEYFGRSSYGIQTLPGMLAGIMQFGGAYRNGINKKEAEQAAVDFVKSEFENWITDCEYYSVTIENAKWFYGVAWDYSFIIVDKKKREIMFIDMTDTD